MSEQRVVVMGLGNLLWADEGFGFSLGGRIRSAAAGRRRLFDRVGGGMER